MSDRAYGTLGVPSSATGRIKGVAFLPTALRLNGIVARLSARDYGDVSAVLDEPTRDPATGIIGHRKVVEQTVAVREAVAGMLREGVLPLIIGSTCPQITGAIAGARDVLGPLGVVYLDGQLDFDDGGTSPTGEPSDMPLAGLAGHGDAAWIAAAGSRPLVAPECLYAIGFRDRVRAAARGSANPELAAPGIHLLDVGAARVEGLDRLARQIERSLAAAPGQFWLHFDVDVLDPVEMPAVNYPEPGGFSWEEIATLIKPLAASSALRGIDVACLDPSLDPRGESAGRLVDLLETVLRDAAVPVGGSSRPG